MLDGGGRFEDGGVDVFGEVRGERGDEEGGDAEPVGDEGSVHADVGGDFTVPVTGGLEFEEAEFEGVLVVGAGRRRNQRSYEQASHR